MRYVHITVSLTFRFVYCTGMVKCSKCGMTGHNKRTCMPRSMGRKKAASLIAKEIAKKTPATKGKTKTKNSTLTVEDRIVKFPVVGSDADLSKVKCIERSFTQWRFTDGNVMWTRTNPNHTHQGDFNLSVMNGFGEPKLPDFICKLFKMTPRVSKLFDEAPIYQNWHEGDTGYIPAPQPKDAIIVVGQDKSGRPFVSFKLFGGGYCMMQQRYVHWANDWVWHVHNSQLKATEELLGKCLSPDGGATIPKALVEHDEFPDVVGPIIADTV